jgi:hypothetical protein
LNRIEFDIVLCIHHILYCIFFNHNVFKCLLFSIHCTARYILRAFEFYRITKITINMFNPELFSVFIFKVRKQNLHDNVGRQLYVNHPYQCKYRSAVENCFRKQAEESTTMIKNVIMIVFTVHFKN